MLISLSCLPSCSFFLLSHTHSCCPQPFRVWTKMKVMCCGPNAAKSISDSKREKWVGTWKRGTWVAVSVCVCLSIITLLSFRILCVGGYHKLPANMETDRCVAVEPSMCQLESTSGRIRWCMEEEQLHSRVYSSEKLCFLVCVLTVWRKDCVCSSIFNFHPHQSRCSGSVL